MPSWPRARRAAEAERARASCVRPMLRSLTLTRTDVRQGAGTQPDRSRTMPVCWTTCCRKRGTAMASAAETLKAYLHCARTPSEEALQRIRTQLKKQYGAEVVITVSVEPELISGYVLQVGDQCDRQLWQSHHAGEHHRRASPRSGHPARPAQRTTSPLPRLLPRAVRSFPPPTALWMSKGMDKRRVRRDRYL